MAHWAQVDENNVVLNILVGDNNDPAEGYDWLVENLGGTWLKTSYNTRGGIHYNPETGEPSEDQSKAFRKNYAQVGFIYNEDIDGFITPKPAESWILNKDTGLWEAPTPYPDGGGFYVWDEPSLSWVLEQ